MTLFPELVKRYLSYTGKCFRHCDKPTTMTTILEDSKRLVGAYTCPDGFVSQVVYFSLKPNLEWFTGFLSSQVGQGNISREDIRVASRHGWELGGDAEEALQRELKPSASIKEAYWTRYPKTEKQKQQAISLCLGEGSRKGCMKLFIHDRLSTERFCPACQGK
jgi:hypothetical protein